MLASLASVDIPHTNVNKLEEILPIYCGFSMEIQPLKEYWEAFFDAPEAWPLHYLAIRDSSVP
jgi:hypothetical protein